MNRKSRKKFKSQIINNKQYPMTKIANSKQDSHLDQADNQVWNLGHCYLRFIWNLVLVFCYFPFNTN